MGQGLHKTIEHSNIIDDFTITREDWESVVNARPEPKIWPPWYIQDTAAYNKILDEICNLK